MSNFNQAQNIQAGFDAAESGEAVTSEELSWMQLAQAAFDSSTDYMEMSLKRQWEKNMASFHSRHSRGSKYSTEAYKYRSKTFRTKTRSMVRRNEAAAAMAYFATGDAVNIEPEDEDNPQQQMSAEICKELLNYRLDKSIPWFKILIGAYQETMNVGVVCSYQYWKYREVTEETEVQEIDDKGQPVKRTVKTKRVVKDVPVIDLRPAENIRISAASDWTDPVSTSPYFIDMIPMFFDEIKARMDAGVDNEDPWFQLTDGEIMSAMQTDYDSLRREREGNERQDSKENDVSVNEFRIIWVHRNFIRKNKKEYVYYTLGTQHLLSEPVTIQQKYRQDNRPYVMGECIIEAHRVYPSSTIQLGEQAQAEINDVANTRMDNVKLAISPQTYVRRGANVDYRALMRRAPGAGVLMDDINADVKQEQIRDVTNSSYQEQDRLNQDFDGVTGSFSAGTEQSNPALRNTLGGQELLSGDSNVMSEYQLRVFNETWVEPVLRQMLDLIKRYETDETVIAIAGKRASIDKKFGKPMEELSWRDFQAPNTLRVSVGFGATNPQKRIEKLSIGFGTVAKFFPQLVMQANQEAVVTEIFGALGYKDGKRFFPSLADDQANPQMQQLQQQIQELQKIIEQKQIESKAKTDVAMIREQGQSERQRMKLEQEGVITDIKTKLESITLQLKAEVNEMARSELLLEQSALVHQQRLAEIQLLRSERDHSEMKNEIPKASAEQVGTDDSKAGLLERNNYGNVPFAEG